MLQVMYVEKIMFAKELYKNNSNDSKKKNY